MQFKVHDFNIGDVVVEWSMTNGELHDCHVYRTEQKGLDYIDLTRFLDESALNEIVQQIMEKSHESGAYDESFEQEYTGEESIA